MKRQRLVRCISIGLAGCISLAGCAGRNVNYDIDKATEAEPSQRGKTGVEQFAGAPAWTDEWTVQTSKGNTAGLSIDADIILPTAEQMSVVEIKETVFDEDYKKSMVRRIFGNEEVRKCDAALEKAEDFTVDAYWGNREGIPYNLNFLEENTENGCSGRSILLSPRDVYQVCPQKFREVENLTYGAWEPQTHGSLTGNSCELSEEEARKEAQSFVDNIESEHLVYAYSEPLVWGDDVNQTGWTAAGYVFYFGFGIDDMAFAEFGTEQNYWNFASGRKETEKPQYSLNACIAVSVTDAGVIGAEIDNPIETTGILERVELLPLEDIQGIIKEQLTNHFGDFRFSFEASVGNTVKLDEMELIYFRVRDKENAGYYSYVPVWRLAGVTRDVSGRVSGIDNQVLINAIDGSVIDFYEEV